MVQAHLLIAVPKLEACRHGFWCAPNQQQHMKHEAQHVKCSQSFAKDMSYLV